MSKAQWWAVIAALMAACGVTSRAEVSVLQNGGHLSPGYAGCKDTWISDEPYEKGSDYGKRPTLRCGGKRHILIYFDLSAIPKDHVVHKAFLRLADVEYPRKRDGKWPVLLVARPLTRDWSESANWLEHTRASQKGSHEGDWKTPGGELDFETDFGQAEKGIVASDQLIAGDGGHIHDLDVTAVVQAWVSGKLPNFGLALIAPPKGPGCHVASNEWYVPTHRPALVVDHGPAGSRPSGGIAIGPLPEQTALNPIAETADAGGPQENYGIVRVGQNSHCALRGASADAYIKEAVGRFPGTWGWMNQCRVGGVAGDISRALLFFDLQGIPKTSSIKDAKLRLFLVAHTAQQATNYRYGAFLLKLPESPGWAPEAVTAAERKPGVPWVPQPGEGVRHAAVGPPLALGKVTVKRDKDRTIPEAIEFDLTGTVRAWAQGKVPNCGILLDNRLEGGAYDFHSSRSFNPELRPYLEITLSPTIAKKPEPIEVKAALPPGDYWVEPMREAHKRFKGKPGTLAMYGDSITVTMAYLANYSWAGKIQPKNCPADVQQEMDLVAKYANLRLWREWKGGEWGNTGMMRSDWLINNIDGWQKKMNPEAAVILFGTNDLGGLCPPEYTENMAASVRRMLADGTVPMLTTVPPASGRMHLLPDYYEAILSIAHGLKVPVIDYYGEILRRRPDDWDGRLAKFGKPKDEYQVPTLISGDGTHPSNPKQFAGDFSEEALSSNGYNLRDYLTLRKYAEVISKVFLAEGKPR